MSTQKDKDVVKAFQKLLRCGKDYEVVSMYKEAGEKYYLTAGTTGHIVRRHYKSIITDEMKSFVLQMNGAKHEEKINLFVEKFDLIRRESRLIIRYIKRGK
jgi:hypothetical protein